MKVNEGNKNNAFKDILVVVFLGIVTILSMFTFLSLLRLSIQSDGFFHFSRAEEIYRNLRSGVPFTFIAAHTFQQTGVGNFLFYPDVFLYPWALLRFALCPVTAYYVWDSLFVFATFVIGYFCMKDYSKDRLRSVFFAIIYGLGTYHVYLGQCNFVLGEFIAYTFLPIVVLGIYHIIFANEKKWPLLAVGMALLTYSHVLSVYIMCFFCAALCLCTLFSRLWINRQRLLALLKAVGLYFLLSAWFFIPLITDYVGQGIVSPGAGFMLLSSPQQMIANSFNPTSALSSHSIGMLLMITAFVGWFFVRKNTQELVTYIIGVCLLLMTTNFIPYTQIQNIKWLANILGVIQFPYRLLSMATLFMAITASFIMVSFVRRGYRNSSRIGLIVFCLGIIMTCYYSEQTSLVSQLTSPTRQYLKYPKGGTPTSYQALMKEAPGKIVNNDNYNDIFDYEVLFGQTDYYREAAFSVHPKWGSFAPKAFSIQQHVMYVNGHAEYGRPYVAPNKISYEVFISKKRAKIDLPVVAYHNTAVYDNGRRVAANISSRGTVLVQVGHGKHYLTVGYKPNRVYYVLFEVALLTWVILILLFTGILHRKK